MKRREFMTLLGGAAAWPLAARAQQQSMPVIGFMSSRSPEDSVNVLTAFRRGLGEGGLIEGENVAIEFRWARGAYDRLPAMAAELVSHRVAVLVAVGGDPSALAAKAATSSIPIVFNSTDPIKSGLVASLNRPGGNATGVYILTSDLEPKRLGLLHELFPGVGLFGAMLNPKFPAAAQQAAELAEAARTIGRPIILLNASTVDGGLMSYGVSFPEAYREVGIYAARILNGAKPADLPVMQSVKFELVINLKTAKALGLTIPDKLLALADEVIE